MSHHAYSLTSRLLIATGLVLVVFLGLMAVVLDLAFQKSTERAVSERLLVQIYGLLSVAEVIDGELLLPTILQEPRFNNPGSGLFSFALDDKAKSLWRSPSSVSLQLEPEQHQSLFADLESGSGRFGQLNLKDATGGASNTFFTLSYLFLWQESSGVTVPFTLVVIENTEAYDQQVGSYRNYLWGGLAGAILILAVIQVLVMRWGLSPVNGLATDLKAIEDGTQDFLDGDYPAELTGVTRNLNILLRTERQQREKYRNTLADLAHSLKTPLAILKGTGSQLSHRLETGDPSTQVLIESIDEQVNQMDQIVAYQLERAVANSPTLIKTSIEVAPVAEKLVAAMRKVYQDKDIHIKTDIVPCTFFGDERDLMEMLGNVLDNACKYGREQVAIRIGKQGDVDLMLEVEDDGPGIPLADRSKILTRGARLDSRESGQGIGLAVVVEIVERYRGHIEINDSTLGGASIRLALS